MLRLQEYGCAFQLLEFRVECNNLWHINSIKDQNIQKRRVEFIIIIKIGQLDCIKYLKLPVQASP